MFVQGYFSVGVYKYSRPGSLYDWIVVFKANRCTSNERQILIEAIADAAQQAPTLLSRQETSNYVTSARSKTGVNKNISAGILQVMKPDRTHLAHADTTGLEKMLYINIKRLIFQGNNFNGEDELSLISDMQKFHICGKMRQATFDIYQKAAIRATKTEITHKLHDRRHANYDYDSTNRISHATFISTNHLIKITIQILEKDVLKPGIDFKVPVRNQCFPPNTIDQMKST